MKDTFRSVFFIYTELCSHIIKIHTLHTKEKIMSRLSDQILDMEQDAEHMTEEVFIDKYGHSSKDYYRNIISNGGSYDFADPQF